MSKIIDLNAFRRKKDVNKELAGDRKPLYMHDKEIRTTEEPGQDKDFAARIIRIRDTMERVDKLMVELKAMANKEKT